MKLVVDANVVISAPVADSTTRELIVTLEPDLLTPVLRQHRKSTSRFGFLAPDVNQ